MATAAATYCFRRSEIRRHGNALLLLLVLAGGGTRRPGAGPRVACGTEKKVKESTGDEVKTKRLFCARVGEKVRK